MKDSKGILAFLLLTFGITYAYEGCLIASGVVLNFGASPGQALAPPYAALLVGMAMWIPALATVIVVKVITKEGFGGVNLRLGPLRPYLISMMLVPATFAAIYLLTFALGLTSPDWRLTTFSDMLARRGMDVAPLPPSHLILPAVFVSSIILGPFVNGIFGFGEELGWRGYLLPKLMPLGKPKAYALVGVIWGLWHAPLIVAGFNYPGYPILGVLAMVGLTASLGIFINEMSLRYRSVILAAWIHGAFNGQAYGLWRLLFPDANPVLGGFTGIVGMLVWTALGLAIVMLPQARKHTP